MRALKKGSDKLGFSPPLQKEQGRPFRSLGSITASPMHFALCNTVLDTMILSRVTVSLLNKGIGSS